MTYKTRGGRQFVVIATGAGPDATLAAFALGGGRDAQPPPASQRPQTESGAVAYTRVCQACHGANGTGGIAPALVPMRKQAAEVLAIVREGTGQMPPVSTRELSDEEVARIFEHLLTQR